MRNHNKLKAGVSLIFLGTFFLILFLPPSAFVGSNNTINVSEVDKDVFVEPIEFSIIETAEIFTVSDNSLIQNFLDEQGVGFTEKFGILTNIALISPNGEVFNRSDIFGISELSVTDELGFVRDLDTIQTTLVGITRNIENSVNIWGTVQFFLDDNLVGEKQFWSSTGGIKEIPLSLVSNLSFKDVEINTARIGFITTEVTRLSAEVQTLQQEIAVISSQPCTNCNGRDTEIRIRSDKIADRFIIMSGLNTELAELRLQIGNNIPINPLFSERDTNFTFTLSDEGRNWIDKSEHFFRVVITEIHANLDSEKDFKKFNWFGEHIAYELKVTVDESKIVVQNEIGSAIEIFKSDNLLVNTSSTMIGSFSGCSIWRASNFPLAIDSLGKRTSFEVFVGDVSLGTLDQSNFNLIQTNTRYCGGYPVQVCCTNTVISVAQWENPITGIPRDADIVIKTGDGQVFEIHTPLEQANYFVNCSSSVYGRTDICTSNFGYSFP